jgi:acyl-CoA reductase-like NAD-dependent aldehyde dehydrogenase
MKTEKLRIRKMNGNLAFVPALKNAADEWADAHGVSLSVIASATFAILAKSPLSSKELTVETALREALGAQPSASEAQLSRRQEVIEEAFTRLRADVDTIIRNCAPAQQVNDHSQTTNHVNEGGIVAKTAFIHSKGKHKTKEQP